MNGLLDIAEQLLIDRVISNKAPVTGESKVKFTLVALSGLTGLLGLALSFYALYLWLSINYSMTATMAVLGASMLCLSLIFALAVFVIMAYKRKKMRDMKKEIIEVAEEALQIFESEISKPVNDNPKTAVLISSFAGYLAGERFL